MKIWGEIPRIQGVYDKQKNLGKITKASEVASKKDVISISSQAKDFQTVMRSLKEIPDIRQDKVNELTERLETGTYDVRGREIADKLIRTAFDTKG